MSSFEAAMREAEIEKLKTALNLTDEEFKLFEQVRDTVIPTLFDVNEILDDTLVGEHETRMSLFTIYILSKICSYVSGPSAGGKSAVMDACIDCLMPGDGLVVEGGSEKAIFDMAKKIEKCKYVEIRELNKINNDWIEIFKSWGEGKPYEYKRSKGIVGGTNDMILPPRPFVVSRADESASNVEMGAEMRSRLVEVTVDGSQKQTKSVMSRQAENVENPFDVKQVDNLKKACLKWHISNLPEYDIYVNPAGGLLKSFIPTVFTTARRDFPKYLKNCEGIARFHYKERMSGTVQGQSTLFITPADMFLNHRIFGTNLVESALRCSHLEKIIIKVLDENGQRSKAEIQRLLRNESVNATIPVIDSHLKHLSDLGYLNVEKPGRENLYSVSDFYEEFAIVPDFRQIVEYTKNTMRSIEHYAPYADEYIERFCTGDIIVQDPITGEDINIFEYKFDKPHGSSSSEENTRIEKTSPKGQLTLF
jgi:hypothetical protein